MHGLAIGNAGSSMRSIDICDVCWTQNRKLRQRDLPFHKASSRTSRHHHRFTMLHLLIDNGENRNHRYNTRLRGIPEATTGGDRNYGHPQQRIRQATRGRTGVGSSAPSERAPEGGTPRFPEMFLPECSFIQSKRRSKVPVDCDGAPVKLFPDLSCLTLLMPGMLLQLLEVFRSSGVTYCWGHPFHLQVSKGADTVKIPEPTGSPLCLFRCADTLKIPEPTASPLCLFRCA